MKKKHWIPIGIVIAVMLLVFLFRFRGCNSEETHPGEETTSPTQGTVETEPTTEPTTGPTTEPTETPTTEPTEAPTTVPTEPVETEPVETEPVETEPPATEPPETEPVETEPIETEPTVTFKEVNETVYTTRDVNMRSGPGSDSEKVGHLGKGTKVTRTGIGDNGWSRVEYDGEEVYVYSDYLSKNKPAEEKPDKSENDNKDNKGDSNKGDKEDNKSETSDDKKDENEDVIIYTYPDGTTGTVPMEGAIYEILPGVFVEYHNYESSVDDEESASGVYHCDFCGKVCGDGSDGTCLRYLMGGYDCKCCGEYVPAHTCHTCDEN